MKKMTDFYAMVNAAKERVIKTMQERGVKELNLVMPYKEWGKEQGYTKDDYEDDGAYDCDYMDYKQQEAPYVVYFDKYGRGIDYRVLRVTLVGDEMPRLELYCEADEEVDTSFYDDDVMFVTMINVYTSMAEVLEMEDEPEYVWVFVAEQSADDETMATITRVFATEEAAVKCLRDFVDGDEGEREYAEKRGWTIEADCDDWFVAYKEGYYCGNHTECSIGKRELKR